MAGPLHRRACSEVAVGTAVDQGIRAACALVAVALAAYVFALATVFLPPAGGLDGPCAAQSSSRSSRTNGWPPGYRCVYRNLDDEVVRVEVREATWADEVVIALLGAAALSLAAGVAGGVRDRRGQTTLSLPDRSRAPS